VNLSLNSSGIFLASAGLISTLYLSSLPLITILRRYFSFVSRASSLSLEILTRSMFIGGMEVKNILEAYAFLKVFFNKAYSNQIAYNHGWFNRN
jgi:hypothetical protein